MRVNLTRGVVAIGSLITAGCGSDESGRVTNPVLVLVFTAVWLSIPVGLIVLATWLQYRQRWYYWRGGKELGTFSAYQLNQLFKTGQVSPKTPIRQVKDYDWHTGVAIEEQPRRLGRSLRFALLATVAGFALGYAAFGIYMGRYVAFEAIFFPPREEVLRARFKLEVAANMPVPIISSMAARTADEVDRIIDKLDEMRVRIIMSAGVFGLAGAFFGGMTARPRATIHKERRVVFKQSQRPN